MAFTGLVFFLKPDVLLGKDIVLTRLLGRVAFLFTVALLFHINGYGNLWSSAWLNARFLASYSRMETFLKKQARAHKYRDKLTTVEIDAIVARHVPRLRSIQVLNFGSKTKWPEVTDEYHEEESRIVSALREDLQNEFRKKIHLPVGSDSHFALNHYLRTI